MKSFINILFTAGITLFLLSGCSSKQVASPTIKEAAPRISLEQLTAEQLLNQANKSSDSTQRTLLLLAASEKFYQQDQPQLSSTALNSIDTSSNIAALNTQTYYRLLLQHLKLGIFDEMEPHQKTAIAIYSPAILDRINIEELKEIVPLLAEALHLQNSHVEGAILLIEYSGILSNKYDFPLLNEQIWSLLRNSDAKALSDFTYTNSDQDAVAWLELARLITQNQINLDSQYRSLKTWQSKWPSHPAVSNPPTELQLLAALPATRPSAITLALPFSGPVEHVGKAVRDGFMAAYYDTLTANNAAALKISFFDTNRTPIETLFSPGQQNNDLIVGPLTKPEVNKVSALELNQTSVLALNYLDAPNSLSNPSLPEKLYQFGLNPDIEITQIAELLNQRNQHKVAFIGPESELGFRLYDALVIELQKHEGQIIESIFYKDQKSLSNSVAKLLGTDQSQARKRHIQNITGVNVEFEPRRRQDIDAIFMLAKPPIAKQLNPLFAYHYGGDIPIYSGSQIHQIEEDKNDLDNISFVDMPWMLSNTINIKNSIQEAIPSSASQYTRFYALGADAFAMAPRLELLRTVKGSQLQGQTGTLTIDENGIVNRQLEVAIFKKGRATVAKE